MGYRGYGPHRQWVTWPMGYRGMGHMGNEAHWGYRVQGYGAHGVWGTRRMGHMGNGVQGYEPHGERGPMGNLLPRYQKDVKLSKRCQMSKNETPRLWRRFTKKLNWHNEVHRYWHQFWRHKWWSLKTLKMFIESIFGQFWWPSYLTSKLMSISVNLIVSI